MKNLSKRPGDRAEDARIFGRALLEAAVTSGLSAQDILARPSLLGGTRGAAPSAVQMASMQRTRQLELDPTTASRIGAVTAYETPAPSVVEEAASSRAPVRTEISDPSALPPGTATTKWVAPPRFETKLLAPESKTAPPGVEETMDDQRRVPQRTVALAPTPPPAPQRVSQIDTTPPLGRISRAPAQTSKPPSSVEATIAGEESPAGGAAEPAPLWRGALLGAACVLAGALGMVAIAWKAGIIAAPPRASIGPLPEVSVARAHSEPPPEFRAPEPPPALPPLDFPVPPRAKAVASSARPAPVGSAAPAGGGRVVVDASSARPGIGQPVDFVAHLPPTARSAKVDGAQFSHLLAGDRGRYGAPGVRRRVGRLSNDVHVPRGRSLRRRVHRASRRGSSPRRSGGRRGRAGRISAGAGGRGAGSGTCQRELQRGSQRELQCRSGSSMALGRRALHARTRPCRTLGTVMISAALVASSGGMARADDVQRPSLLDRSHTVAEAEGGIIALPTAPISASNRGGSTPIGAVGNGDATVEIGAHILYRADRAWAIGAGITFAPEPKSEHNYGGAGNLVRTHSSSYLFLVGEFRFFPLRSRWIEFWVGATGGTIVIADRFATNDAPSVPAVLGINQITVNTGGASLGGQTGLDYLITDRLKLGLAVRGDLWLLPNQNRQLSSCDAIGDCPTLHGAIAAFELGVSIGYRIPL